MNTQNSEDMFVLIVITLTVKTTYELAQRSVRVNAWVITSVWVTISKETNK